MCQSGITVDFVVVWTIIVILISYLLGGRIGFLYGRQRAKR